MRGYALRSVIRWGSSGLVAVIHSEVRLGNEIAEGITALGQRTCVATVLWIGSDSAHPPKSGRSPPTVVTISIGMCSPPSPFSDTNRRELNSL